MQILQEDDRQRGAFYIEENGERIAELAYTWRGDKLMSIDHTEVDEKLEGKGVGSSLVQHVVNYARSSGTKLILYCPFASTVFKRHKEYSDVLSASLP